MITGGHSVDAKELDAWVRAIGGQSPGDLSAVTVAGERLREALLEREREIEAEVSWDESLGIRRNVLRAAEKSGLFEERRSLLAGLARWMDRSEEPDLVLGHMTPQRRRWVFMVAGAGALLLIAFILLWVLK